MVLSKVKFRSAFDYRAKVLKGKILHSGGKIGGISFCPILQTGHYCLLSEVPTYTAKYQFSRKIPFKLSSDKLQTGNK